MYFLVFVVQWENEKIPYYKKELMSMGENKEYVSRPDDMGNVHISEDVLAVIAAASAREVEGVGGLTAHLGTDLAEQLLGKKNQTKGVHILVEEDTVTMELSILIKYGCIIPDVARAVQESVISAVEATSGLTVKAVNIHVCGIVFGKEAQKAQ